MELRDVTRCWVMQHCVTWPTFDQPSLAWFKYLWTFHLSYYYSMIRTLTMDWDVIFGSMVCPTASREERKFQKTLRADSGHENWEKYDWVKTKQFYSLFDASCSKKHLTKKGYYHNPILTLRIFSDIQHANQGNLIDLRTGRNHPNMIKSANPGPRLKDEGILWNLTKFDRSLIRAMVELR